MAKNASGDVRMKGFAKRSTVEQAWNWLDGETAALSGETVALDEAGGRVLASDVTSRVDVPRFRRAMMDGFAVQAESTQGAGGYHRLALEVIGESLPANPFSRKVGRAECVRIMTGAPMPDGADAVLPVEVVEIDAEQSQRIYALADVAPQKHVGAIGEDVSTGQTVLEAGRRLRPQDLGVLSSIGVGHVEVVRRPTVRIVVTGNELLPPGSIPEGFKIVDANSPILSALIQRDGGVVRHPGIVPDDPQEILNAMRDEADVVLVSGGSSVGKEDHAPQMLREHGELPIHGVAMRPSSPAGMGKLDGRLVFLLPGNPVSCLCAYDFFAGRAIRDLAGRRTQWPYRSVEAPLKRKLVSTVGRVDYARVCLDDEGAVEPLAVGGASVLSSTTRADGFVVIDADSEGQGAGAMVRVYLYDG